MLGGKSNKVTDGHNNVLAGGNVVINDLEQYEAHVERRIAAHEATLTKVHAAQLAANDAEKAALQLQINLLNQQIETDRARLRDVDTAFAEYRAKIAELELLLTQATGATAAIGANRIADAKAALDAGDASKADEIFAEVEALEAEAVKRAADAAYGRGLIAEEQVRWGDAADHYVKAARLNPSYDTLLKAGTLLWRAGRHGEAISQEEALLALSQAEFGENCTQTATAMNNLAESYRAAERYDQAEPLFRQAIEFYEKTFGNWHPVIATPLNNLAGLLRDTSRFDQAESLYQRAMQIRRKAFGEFSPEYATSLNSFSILLRATKRFDEAKLFCFSALRIRQKTLGEAHPDYAQSLKYFAWLNWQTNHEDEALRTMAEAGRIYAAALGADHPDTKQVANDLATMRAALTSKN